MRKRAHKPMRGGFPRIAQVLRSRGYVALLIVALMVICLLSVLIPQEGAPAHEAWVAAHPGLAPVMEWAGFHRIFVSAPFITLLVMLTFSTSFSVAGRLNQLRSPAKKMGWLRLLVSRRRVIGSLIFHTGLVGLVVAAAASFFTRSEGSLILTEGQVLDVNREVLQFTKMPQLEMPSETPFQLRLDKFHPIHDGRWGTPDYASEVTVLKDGREVQRGSVSVNHPLVQGNVTLYQSIHGFAPLFELSDTQGRPRFASYVTLNSERDADPVRYRDEFVIPGYGLSVETEFFPDAYMMGERLASRSPVARNPAMLVTVSRGAETLYSGPVFMGEKVDLGGNLQFGFTGVRYWTGFDTIRDSGVGLLFGFAWLALAGLVVRFMPRWNLHRPVRHTG